MARHTSYIGRFAPSPSGPLHFGSLVAALGSYLQAKKHQGKWLLRIEDIDPPREVPGSADSILTTLEAFGLEWDGDVLYQSKRESDYQAQITQWLDSGQAYYCQCTRKQIKAAGGYYPGTCRALGLSGEHTAVRLHTDAVITEFQDKLHGTLTIPRPLAEEDFIIKRRDGLYAYNLAVVLDDIHQGVTEVVRGADLIEPTGRQIALYQLLGEHQVSYVHLPLALNSEGNKLSKQNHASAVDNHTPKPALLAALNFLGLHFHPEWQLESLDTILEQAVDDWSLELVPRQTEVTTAF